MFLPDYVESAFDHASIRHDGVVVPLVRRKHITYESREAESAKRLPHPLVVSGSVALLGVMLTWWDFRRKKRSRWFDTVLFTLAGLIGILLLFLWFFTNHQAAANNFNLLWAFPMHFVAGIALLKSRKWLIPYFLGAAILTGVTLLSWPILPQMLHYALIPLVATLGIRAFTQYYFLKTKMGIKSKNS
jgi:hypothetical protein